VKEYGFKVDAMITIGILLREILNVEKNEEVSVIIIGSHGKNNID
jgi:hypothetical protein